MLTSDSVNNPALLAPVKVEVLRPFCIEGKRIERGETVTLPKYVAADLMTIGKARLVR
jgi:hypothetical protein